MSFLEVINIGRRLQDAWIASGISFIQYKLQNIVIAGETGSGKSTLLKIIAGLVQPHEGKVFFEAERVEGPDEKLIPGHPGIAYLSQVFELPKFLRVEQVLAYASKIFDTEAQRLFEICHITHLLKRRTDELSGGEQQRIALARLLVMQPKLLLLDEPFSNLDLIHKSILKRVLQAAQEQLQLSIILTSHDPQDTLPWANTIGVMQEGKMVQWGTPEQIYKQPENEYVAGLFGKYNLLNKPAIKLLLNEDLQNDKILVRPEAFSIEPATDNTANAQITAIRFAGSYYEADVQIAVQSLVVYTKQKDWRRGDSIKLSLHSEDVYHLKN